jgi:hypothetical protein
MLQLNMYIYIYPQGMHSGSHAAGFVMPSSLDYTQIENAIEPSII